MSRKPPAGSPPGHAKVVSIVRAIERRRVDEAHARASATHLRKDELDAEMAEQMADLAELELDEGIAWCEGESSVEARHAWAQLRSLRALRRCMHGDVDGGLAEWAEVAAAEPGFAGTYLMRARWVGQTDPAAALADTDRAVAAEPTSASAYARRGDWHRVLGDQDRALADYRRAVGLDPDLHDVHYLLGTVLGAAGKLVEARAAYSRAIRLAPRYVEPHLGRAGTLIALGDHAGAVRDLDRVLDLDPTRDDIRAQRALCLAKSGDLGAAADQVQAFAGAMDGDPGAHEAFTLVGQIHLANKDPEKALAAFDRALELEPDDVVARGRRGKLRADAGDHRGALEDLDRAVALAPDDPENHVVRARSLALVERMAEAVEAASRAIALSPDHILAHRLRAVYRSHADQSPEGASQVKADLRRAWELSPRTAVLRTELIEYLTNRGDVDEALAVLDRALELEPESAELYYERGSTRSRRAEIIYSNSDVEDDETEEASQARNAAAHADIERALALGKRDEDTWFELVRAREGMGDKDATMAELDRALTALPDDVMLLHLRQDWRRHRGDIAGSDADRAHLEELGSPVRES